MERDIMGSIKYLLVFLFVSSAAFGQTQHGLSRDGGGTAETDGTWHSADSGKVLTSHGTTAPTWVTAGGGGDVQWTRVELDSQYAVISDTVTGSGSFAISIQPHGFVIAPHTVSGDPPIDTPVFTIIGALAGIRDTVSISYFYVDPDLGCCVGIGGYDSIISVSVVADVSDTLYLSDNLQTWCPASPPTHIIAELCIRRDANTQYGVSVIPVNEGAWVAHNRHFSGLTTTGQYPEVVYYAQ